MTLVIPEALTLMSIIIGMQAFMRWLIDLGTQAIDAVEHCADVLSKMVDMRAWIEKVRKHYEVGYAIMSSVTKDLTMDIQHGLNDILSACGEVEMLAERIGTSKLGSFGVAMKALRNKSKMEKVEEQLNWQVRKFENLQRSAEWRRASEELETLRWKEEKKKSEDQKETEEKKVREPKAQSESAGGRESLRTKRRQHEVPRTLQDTSYLGEDPPPYTPNVNTSGGSFIPTAKTFKVIGGAGAGAGCALAAIGTVALCNPVGLVAAAGALTYGLVAAGSVGGGVLAWANCETYEKEKSRKRY